MMDYGYNLMVVVLLVLVGGIFSFLVFVEPVADCVEDCQYYCNMTYNRTEYNLIPDFNAHRVHAKCICSDRYDNFELRDWFQCQYMVEDNRYNKREEL